jgi:hypothetical protein
MPFEEIAYLLLALALFFFVSGVSLTIASQ